eukprot:1594700-Pyramimonas_sp.AAC.1
MSKRVPICPNVSQRVQKRPTVSPRVSETARPERRSLSPTRSVPSPRDISISQRQHRCCVRRALDREELAIDTLRITTPVQLRGGGVDRVPRGSKNAAVEPSTLALISA